MLRYLALFAILAFALWLALRPGAATGDDVERLRRRYRHLIHLPDEAADATLDRAVAGWRDRHPGRSERWYLEQVLSQLERDRR